MANEADQVVAAINNYGTKIKTELGYTTAARDRVKGKVNEVAFVGTSNQMGSVQSTEYVRFVTVTEDTTEFNAAQTEYLTIKTILHAPTQIVWKYNETSLNWESQGAVVGLPEEFPKGRFYFSEWNSKCFYFSQSAVLRKTA